MLQVALLARATQLWENNAIAIRWASLGNVGLTKSELFNRLANHKDMCKTSDSRPFCQDNGSTKALTFTVILIEAFSQQFKTSLKEGISKNDILCIV